MKLTETRQFTVSPNIIYSLIKAQAGSLAKAVTECVMNSVDAFAKRVDVKVTPTHISIVDDGVGFQSREEIAAWFETLGFDHNVEGNHRSFGAFGIGRAQLWSFAPTKWTTHSFVMDVDIKNKGLDYDLHETVQGKSLSGLAIEGKFYKPLEPAELIRLEQELRRLIQFVDVPVTLNGVNLCTKPASQRWDFETDDAWFQFTADQNGKHIIGNGVEVFNMGVRVFNVRHTSYNVSGRMVTKPGVKLALNMARNEVLVAECPVWARVVKVLEANAVEPVAPKAKAVKVSAETIAERVQQASSGSTAAEAFVDIRGRNRSLSSIWRVSNVICFADPSSEKAKSAHQLKLAVVLKPETLQRFGCKNAKELQEMLFSALANGSDYLREKILSVNFYDTLAEALPTMDDRFEVLRTEELDPMQRVLVQALSRTKNRLRQNCTDYLGIKPPYGEVRAGKSDVAKAWTMSHEIVLDHKVLKQATRGFSGFQAAIGHVMHEMAAGMVDSNTEHEHPSSFYEHLQTLWLDSKLIDVTIAGYQYFTRQCSKKQIELPKAVIDDLAATA